MDEHPNGVAWINGDWCDAAEAALSILDCGVQPGLTVFDTAGVTAGRVFRLDAHLNRFYASLKVVRFDTFPHTREELERIVIETIRRSGLRDALVTFMATRGLRTVDRWGPMEQLVPTLVVHCRPAALVGKKLRETGYRACVSSVRSLPTQCLPPELKHYNRIPNYLADLDAADKGVDVALLVDLDGDVTEGTTFNVVLTPANGMLRGVTRDTMIKIAAQHDLPVTEGRLTPYDLCMADEVFATSVSRGATAIVEIDHRRIGDGRPGPITARLNDTYWSWRLDSVYSTQVYEQEQTVRAG